MYVVETRPDVHSAACA
jgi:hypothetical protein